MTKDPIIKTAWGSQQLIVDGLESLTQNKEIALRQEWKTPLNFWKVINKEFDFDIDVTVNEENTLCSKFINWEKDSLSESICWVVNNGAASAYCNPGFGNMLPWILKASTESKRNKHATVCVLGLCAPSTSWWQAVVDRASEIRLLAPRVQFQSPDLRIPQSSNARECALFVFTGVDCIGPAKITTWRWK